ncbi:MAG: diphthine synthase [archaeon]
MLYIIGTGIYDERDLSIKALDALKKCVKIYAEFYTSPIKVNLPALEKMAKKKITVLDRSEVEEQDIIISSAKKCDTAFLVGGDALSATTHIGFALECRKQGIPIKIIHSSSIFTAVAESGLQLYKFGRTVSLPYKKDNYFPESPYDNIRKNLKDSLHTLLLLDIGMTANEAIGLLMELEEKLKKKLFSSNTKIVCLAHLGSDQGSTIRYGSMKDLKKQDFGALPHTIIIPGTLHFTEEEYLESL